MASWWLCENREQWKAHACICVYIHTSCLSSYETLSPAPQYSVHRKVIKGSGMAQLVKYLLRKHEVLSLISGTHTKMIGLVACACYPSTGEVETHGFLGAPWLGCLDQSASSS